MTKTPEQMAEEYAANKWLKWDDYVGEWDDYVVDEAKDAYLAGYEAASDKYLEQIRHLEMELQQAKLSAMKLEAER